MFDLLLALWESLSGQKVHPEQKVTESQNGWGWERA